MASAINKPTNTQQKEKDVNTKLQLYGIYSAFSSSKVPSNKQIDIALNSALESQPLSNPSKKLSAEGQHLAADLRNVIEQAKLLFLTKNDGNLLQDFVWQTKQITGGDAKKLGAPVDKDTVQQHGNEILEGLRTLGTLLISNGQFRKLLTDASILVRDMAGDAATSAAARVKPSEDQLAQIDKAAEDNTWHDVPDLSKDKLKQQWTDKRPFGKKDAGQAATDATEAAKDQPTGQDAAAVTTDTAKKTADEKVPDEQKEKAKSKTTEYRDRTKTYLSRKMPKERRDQTIWRLKKMIIEVQGHQDYQRAIDTLLRLAEEYTGHSKHVAGQGAGAVKGAHADNALQAAEADLKTLIERFANGTSLDDLFDAVNNIYRDADQDPELKNWFKAVDTYIRKCLQEQGFIMQDAVTDEWNKLYDQGNFLLRNKYRNHTDRIVDELKFYTDQFDQDPQNKAFAEALQRLFDDLGHDESGKSVFKPHLVRDVSEIILPAFLEDVRYVPIPRIEYSDPTIDVVVENLVVESDNLMPNVFELTSDNYFRWGRKSHANQNKNKLTLAVSGVQMDLRDVSFYVKRKQGFPAITDKGVMDILVGGSGFSFKVKMETADKSEKAHYFKITKVDVDIKNFSIKVKESKHKLLFKLAKPVALRAIKPALRKAIEKQIKENVYQLDGVIYEIHEEVKAAQADVVNNPDPENVQNVYQRYYSAVQKRILEGKQKKVDVPASDKKVNVAVTQDTSILQDVQLPGGISSKATEYKQLAAKGDKWESPVFGIGSAKETTDIPKPPEITRKRHNVNMGGPKNTSLAEAEKSVDGVNGRAT